MVYDDRHRAFLQSIMQGGVVEDQNVEILCANIFNENIDVSSVISSINDKLFPIAMALKSGTCELTGQKYWSVVGTTHEDSVMFPSEFSPAQRAFLRVVYSEIVSSDDGCISSTDCLNLANNLEVKFSVGDADQLLRKLIRKKWLHCKDGTYYMGIRSIIELMPYFRSTYQENFHNCFLCKDVMFHGYKCESCDKVYHFYCISRKMAEQNDDKCPNCSNNMDSSSLEEFSNSQIPNQTQATHERENGIEPMNISDDENFSQQLSKPRKSKRRTKAN